MKSFVVWQGKLSELEEYNGNDNSNSKECRVVVDPNKNDFFVEFKLVDAFGKDNWQESWCFDDKDLIEAVFINLAKKIYKNCSVQQDAEKW